MTQRLPFGPVDELNCYLDAPHEPNSVHLETTLPGLLDETAFRAAAMAAITGIPRANSHRARPRPLDTSYFWEPVPALETDPISCVTWSSADELARYRVRFLASSPPLSTAPPLRLLLARRPDSRETCVVLSAHHAAFDGLSCLDLLGAIARAYREPSAGPSQPAAARKHEQEPGAHRTTGVAPLRPRTTLRPVTRIAAVPSADASAYGFCFLPALAVRAVRSQTATVNDMLIAALIVTIGRWNAEHGWAARNIRVTMPINSRPANQEMLTGNYSRLAAVSARWHAGVTDPRAILISVTQQTRWAKEHDRPQVGLCSRGLATTRLPVAAKRLIMRSFLGLPGRLICDTTLVSNLGNVAVPPQFGSLTATRMAFSTAAHMPRGLSAGAISLGGQLHVCIRYRRALLTDAAAAVFAGMYSTALDDLTMEA
jgi:NRPS condensation-like uncharacterized protein